MPDPGSLTVAARVSVSWLLAGGADLKAVMDGVGHKRILTTQQYLGRRPGAEDRALAAFEAVRHRRSSSFESVVLYFLCTKHNAF